MSDTPNNVLRLGLASPTAQLPTDDLGAVESTIKQALALLETIEANGMLSAMPADTLAYAQHENALLMLDVARERLARAAAALAARSSDG